jgi:SAM-dependent methyltransferase
MFSAILAPYAAGLLLSLSQQAPTGQSPSPTGVALLRQEAAAVEPLVESRLAKSLIGAVPELPAIAPRTLFRDEAKGTYLTEAEARKQDAAARGKLKPFPVDESFYYTTKYGSPLAYLRPLDLLGRAGVADPSGLKVLDFGYGTIGHLRLLASRGADVTGVDVDPLLRALYAAPDDQGPVPNRGGEPGRVRLFDGRFPADPATRSAVGNGYDLFLSKNTLKNGYVHPERPVDRRRLLNLEVDDAAFVRAVHDLLKPGGWVLIYNICPAPAPPDQPYKPWADGRCPFARPVWEGAGFEILAFDRDDSESLRALAHALGWDRGPDAMDLNRDLFAHYSLLRKARR